MWKFIKEQYSVVVVGAILLLRKVQSDEKSVAIENRQTDFFCVLSSLSFFSIIPQNSTNIIVMEGVKIPCISVDFLSLTACFITAYFTVYSASFILLDSLWFLFFFPWCAIQLNSNSIRGRFFIHHTITWYLWKSICDDDAVAHSYINDLCLEEWVRVREREKDSPS